MNILEFIVREDLENVLLNSFSINSIDGINEVGIVNVNVLLVYIEPFDKSKLASQLLYPL